MLLTNWLATVNKGTRRRNSRKVLQSKQIPVASHVEVLEDRTLLDAAGPQILFHTPNEVRNDTFDHIDVTFNEQIDVATFTTDDVSLVGPDSAATVTGILHVSGNTYRINFSPLSVRGNYEALIGPDIADLAGNLMNQNQDGVNGDPTTDAYSASFVYIDF